MHASMAAGAVSVKKPHHIITLRFSEVVNDHANYIVDRQMGTFFWIIKILLFRESVKVLCGLSLAFRITARSFSSSSVEGSIDYTSKG